MLNIIQQLGAYFTKQLIHQCHNCHLSIDNDPSSKQLLTNLQEANLKNHQPQFPRSSQRAYCNDFLINHHLEGKPNDINQPLTNIWCVTCQNNLLKPQIRCLSCGVAMPSIAPPSTLNSPHKTVLTTDSHCGQCLTKPPIWDRLYCLGDYQDPLKYYLNQFKFQKKQWLAKPLATLLAQNIPQPANLLIPVPLHWRRQLIRGFNQSYDLAYALQQTLNANGHNSIQINAHIFQRHQATPSQRGLSKTQRQQNLKHAFRLKTPPLASHIALVDDVVTTGSTLQPLCKILRQVGVEQIDIYCLCRTQNPEK